MCFIKNKYKNNTLNLIKMKNLNLKFKNTKRFKKGTTHGGTRTIQASSY